METKRCSRCEKVKPLEKFYLQVASADGRFSWCKQCMKEYARQYHAEHREEKREYLAQYNAEHREEKKARGAQWRADNPEYNRQYCNDHREERKKYQARWRSAHREERAAYAQRRRARVKGNGGFFTAEEWRTLCKGYGNKCLCCGRGDVPLTVDHVIPISKGGSNNIKNCQPLCKRCNSKKHTQTIDYRN